MGKEKEDIEDRLFGLESIMHSIHHNIELLEYLAYNLHRKQFNLTNNMGLYFIWGNLMGEVLLNFYKVSHKNEKHSFQKILNISISEEYEINHEIIQKNIDQLTESYSKTNFEKVRSKYVAHQDIEVPKMKTELPEISKFGDEVFSLFEIFTDEFNIETEEFNSQVKNSFAEIFEY